MFSSKKILYFVIIALLLICNFNGIDYNASLYDEEAETSDTFVDFSDSGFFAINDYAPSQQLVALVEDENGAYDDGGSVSVDTDPQQGGNDQPGQPGGQPGQPGQPEDQPGQPDQPGESTTAVTTTTTQVTTPTVAPTAYTPETAYTTTTTTTRPTPPPTTTTYYTTTTTTTQQTAAPTTEAYFSDTGSIHFAYSQVTIYAGASTTLELHVPIGSQRRATFSSKDTMVATATNYTDTIVEIYGVAVGTTWIQATNSSGEVAYCRVVVTDFAHEVIRLTNQERAAYGVPTLSEGGPLVQQMANIRLSESSRYFSHTRPNGAKFSTVAGEIGLNYRHIGENLANGQTSPAEVIEQWMASTSHRSNILSPNYTQICVAYGIGSDGSPYWVQIFCNPA